MMRYALERESHRGSTPAVLVELPKGGDVSLGPRREIAATNASESFTVSLAATLPKKREVYGISHPLIAIIIGVEVVFRC